MLLMTARVVISDIIAYFHQLRNSTENATLSRIFRDKGVPVKSFAQAAEFWYAEFWYNAGS